MATGIFIIRSSCTTLLTMGQERWLSNHVGMCLGPHYLSSTSSFPSSLKYLCSTCFIWSKPLGREGENEIWMARLFHPLQQHTADFPIYAVVMSYKATTNIESANTRTTAPRGNTGLGSFQPLVTTVSSTHHYITLFYVCFCLKATLFLMYVIYLSTFRLRSGAL